MKRNRLNTDPHYTVEDVAVAVACTIGGAAVVSFFGVLVLGILGLL